MRKQEFVTTLPTRKKDVKVMVMIGLPLLHSSHCPLQTPMQLNDFPQMVLMDVACGPCSRVRGRGPSPHSCLSGLTSYIPPGSFIWSASMPKDPSQNLRFHSAGWTRLLPEWHHFLINKMTDYIGSSPHQQQVVTEMKWEQCDVVPFSHVQF